MTSTFCAYLPYGIGLSLSASIKLTAVILLLFLPTIISARYDEFSTLAFCNTVIGWIPPVWIGLLIWGYAIRKGAKKEGVSSSAYEVRDWIKPVFIFSLCLAATSLMIAWLLYHYYLYKLPNTFFAPFFAVFEWHFIALILCFLFALITAFIPKYKTPVYRAGAVCMVVLVLASFMFSSNLTLLKQGEHREVLERFSTEVFRSLAQKRKDEGSYPQSLSDVSPPLEIPAVFANEGQYRNHGEYFELYLGSDYQALRFDSRVGVWQRCMGDSCS